MNQVTETTAEPRSLCPTCGRLAIQATRRVEASTEDIGQANYLCPNRHLWIVKWLINEEVTA